MHIGFLSPEYVIPETPSGGLANYLKKTGHALLKRGHKISIIVLSERNYVWDDSGVKIYEIKKKGIPSFLPYNLKFDLFVSSINYIIRYNQVAKMVWKIHHENPFDILQASSYMSPGYKLLKNQYIPVVCRISSYAPLMLSAYGRKCYFKDYLLNWFEIHQVRDSDSSFAPSQLLATVYHRFEGCDVKVIRTPIDFELTKEINSSFYEEHFSNIQYLLYFGQFSKIKGVDIIAEAIPFILDRYHNIHIVLIGRDDGFENGEKLTDYVKLNCKNHLNRLHYYPPLSKSEIVPILLHAAGVLMPSRVDNYPNACLEAQSLGIPVIGTYDSSLDEMITEGKTGFLAENESTASLIEAIQRLLDQNPEELKIMKKNILDLINNIKEEDRISQLIEYYECIIKNFGKK
jgi:glycosyltransferase involved in cell wall biosynthesis